MKDIKECRSNKERWVNKQANAAKRGSIRRSCVWRSSDHSCVKIDTEMTHHGVQKKGGYRAALEDAQAACLEA